MPGLHRRLPYAGDHGPLSARRDEVRLIRHNRIARSRIARADQIESGGLGIRLRHLPGCLPLVAIFKRDCGGTLRATRRRRRAKTAGDDRNVAGGILETLSKKRDQAGEGGGIATKRSRGIGRQSGRERRGDGETERRRDRVPESVISSNIGSVIYQKTVSLKGYAILRS